MHQIYWMLNVLCEKKNLLCYKPKYHLPEEKKKNPVSFQIQSIIINTVSNTNFWKKTIVAI